MINVFVLTFDTKVFDTNISPEVYFCILFKITFSRHFTLNCCVLSTDACKEFSGTVATAFGPNGMNKMVINHLEKLFVTNDAATIIRELEVEHPAAKMMILGKF